MVSSVTTQKPLELILARNLMSALSTPAFLVDEGGILGSGRDDARSGPPVVAWCGCRTIAPP